MDASNVYSSEEEIADHLRTKTGGRLRSTKVTSHGRDDRLPTCDDIIKEVNNHLPESCGLPGSKSFGAGTCEYQAYTYIAFELESKYLFQSR